MLLTKIRSTHGTQWGTCCSVEKTFLDNFAVEADSVSVERFSRELVLFLVVVVFRRDVLRRGLAVSTWFCFFR